MQQMIRLIRTRVLQSAKPPARGPQPSYLLFAAEPDWEAPARPVRSALPAATGVTRRRRRTSMLMFLERSIWAS